MKSESGFIGEACETRAEPHALSSPEMRVDPPIHPLLLVMIFASPLGVVALLVFLLT